MTIHTGTCPLDCPDACGMPRPKDCAEGYGVNVLTGPEISDLGDGATFFSTRIDLVAVADLVAEEE